MTNVRRYLAVMGNAGDIREWSGTPFHFYRAGREMGLFEGALDLRLERVRWRRRLWNLAQVIKGQRRGGYQYSRDCLGHAFSAVADEVEGSEIISHFQVFPPPDACRQRNVTFSFYIDMPLTRLFDDYAGRKTIGKAIAAEALNREKEAYTQARFVVCMSAWAARAVRDEYGIPEEKIRVVLPGANMDEQLVRALTRDLDEEPIETHFTEKRPFRLGFTGKHPERKGLPRLIRAAEVLRSRKYPVEVAVMGTLDSKYLASPAVRSLGYIDKQSSMTDFVRAVQSYDLGCLPSYAEGLGISTLECLRLGVPVLGTRVGGIPDCVPPGAGILVPADVDGEAIAGAIQPLLDNPDEYAAMRREARRVRDRYTWTHTVESFKTILDLGGSPARAATTAR